MMSRCRAIRWSILTSPPKQRRSARKHSPDSTGKSRVSSGGASGFLARIDLGGRLTHSRVLFGYVALKHFFKFSPKERWRDIFALVEPREQSCTASAADPGNVAFAVGADLANVAQKGRRSIAFNRVKVCPNNEWAGFLTPYQSPIGFFSEAPADSTRRRWRHVRHDGQNLS